MGNKHSKREYINILNELGDLLWKLAIVDTKEKQDEIIENLKYKLTDDDVEFVFNCKEFNPMHYLIISSFWLPSQSFTKLCKLVPTLIEKCKYQKPHKNTTLLVFQNNNHLSNVNLDFIRMEKVKASLKRTGTMDYNSSNLYEIRKNSLTQYKEDILEYKIKSYTNSGVSNEEDNPKKLKKPPPIINKIQTKAELERPITYYLLTDEEKKSFDNNIDKHIQAKEQINKRVSTKMLWFKYALFNKELWEEDPSCDGLIETINIGEIGYLSLISLLQIKYAKFSSIKNFSDNLSHIYKIIMNHNINNIHKKRSSVKDKIKNIFNKF